MAPAFFYLFFPPSFCKERVSARASPGQLPQRAVQSWVLSALVPGRVAVLILCHYRRGCRVPEPVHAQGRPPVGQACTRPHTSSHTLEASQYPLLHGKCCVHKCVPHWQGVEDKGRVYTLSVDTVLSTYFQPRLAESTDVKSTDTEIHFFH